jgi:hypothetical protein
MSANRRLATLANHWYTTARRSARDVRLGDSRTRTMRMYGLGSDALVLHCPGPQRIAPNPFRHSWARACERFFADEQSDGAFADHDDLTIVTYSNYEHEVLLELCLRRLGLRRFHVLGQGITDWQWLHKVSLTLDLLESGVVQTRYVMCLDGDDVLIVGDPALAVARLRETGARLLFCGTRGNQPPSPECWEFENSVPEYRDPRHRHVNAGAFIGESQYLRTRLREISDAHAAGEPWCFSKWGFDDQLAWRHMHMRYHPEIKVDAGCRVFMRFDEDR